MTEDSIFLGFKSLDWLLWWVGEVNEGEVDDEVFGKAIVEECDVTCSGSSVSISDEDEVGPFCVGGAGGGLVLLWWFVVVFSVDSDFGEITG